MKGSKERGGAHLLPDTPPARLPEETLLARLRRDKRYRRSASLLHALLYRPRRLLTPHVPSRVAPSALRRELGYRLVAIATSLALLIGMVSLAPLNPFSLRGKARAAGSGGDDYSWLLSTSYDGSTADKAYQISNEDQLTALAKLVEGLTTPTSTMSFTYSGDNYVVGPGEITNLPSSFFLIESPDLKDDVERTEESATPVPEPEPEESPSPAPAESEPPLPVETISPAPSEEPAPETTQEPAPLPSPAPEEEVDASLPSALFSFFTVGEESAPSQEPRETAAPSATPEVSPSNAPSHEPTPMETVSPIPSEEPTPAESVPPVPSEEPTPVESVPPAPSEEPMPTERETPEPSPEPSDAAKKTGAAGNTEALLGEAPTAPTYSINVPIGMEGLFFKLMADLDLSNYDGGSGGGASYYWTPIGILSSFDANSVPSGTPFLGTFDGGGHTVTGFQYAPDPDRIAADSTDSMSGYGLFGYVGTGGAVKNLNFKMTRSDGVTALPWVLSNALGGENYAVGVVAAASSGGISGCTVTQADLSYTVAADGSAISSVGGIAGLVYVGNVSTSVDSCVFLGKISNTLAGTSNTAAYANQRVGGIAGALGIAVATTPLSKCAAGVDIDIHNGSSMSNTGGVGGLAGYCSGSNPNTNITDCFTTGAIYVKHTAGGLIGRNNTKLFLRDSFSTVALGVTAKNIPNADFTLNTVESIGGLIGNRAQNATTLTNVYFAGGLLAPQFGAVAGWQICNSATLGLTNVAVDDTQAPHALAKYSEPAIDNSLLIRDWNTFTANAGAAWSAADTTYLPQLKWARDSDSAVIQTLSQAAAKRWVTLSSANAVKGSDGTYSLYRLKDVSGAAPAALGDLTRTTDYKADGVIVGGIYTGSATVSGTSVPAARWAVTAANQAEGNANLIDTGENFLRFLNRANLAGGGYLGADFTLSGAISGTAIPAYSGTFFPFCGSLTGETGSSLSALAYPKGATGLFNTAFSATFQNLTFNNITIGNVSLGASGSLYFGLLAGRIASSSLNNVDVNSFSYTYQDPSSGSYYQSNITPIGLVGTIPSESVSTVFTNCDVAGLAVNIKARTNANSSLRVYVGGLLGSNSSSSLSIADCTVSGAISATLSSNSTSNNLAYVGGFVGYDSGNITVTGGRVFANLVGGTAGGLLGRGAPSALTNCLFSGSVSTTDFSTSTTATSAAAGGLVGYNTRAVTIEQCAVFGSVTSRYYAGGLLGYSSTNPTIRSSYASAIVSAAAAGGAAGGLVGYAPRVLMNTAGMPSYFVGQVWAPGPYGVFAGQTTNVNASLLANSVYDSTLTQRGIALVGSYVTAPTGGAAAKPGAAAWTTLAPTNSTIWSYAAGARSYPQLKWMSDSTDVSVREISRVSTYQLFDNPSTITSLYSMAPAHPFSVTLPAGISASAATPNSFVQSGVSGSTTTYTVTGTEDEGPLKFTYSGVTAGGSPLSLSYTIAKQSFDYGEGTASKPFIIYNLDQLEIFRDFVDSGKNSVGVYYQISEAPMSASDDFSALGPVTIDMGSLVWSGTLASLAGQLDGHGSTLQNLTTSGWTNSQGTWSAGLLGGLGDGSSVKDLTITGAEINGLSNSGSTSAAGILSATARGATVTNVRVDGVISAGRNVAVGGLVGSSVGPLTLADCRTDVAITALGGDGADAIGAGGLVGSMSGVGNAKANISQCAAQGSIVDWGGVGGLVGYVNGSAFTLIITNSYSLVNFSDTGASGSVQAGGFLGRVVNVNGGTNQNYYIKIDSCYYAGENNLSTASTRYRGGFVGGASSSSATATGYGNLHILNCAYNTDGADIDARANLSYSGTFTPAYYWSKADTGTALPGLAWVGDSPAFQMSQGSPQGVMADWNPSVWNFADGFYPHLSGDTAWSGADTRLAHLAIHYTKAARGTRNFSNVFVRADGAALSTTASPTVVRVTGNGRMAVATCPDLGPSVSLTVTLDGATRTVSFTPSTNSSGNRDVSIYYINPDGMWEDKVWLVYTADALAGLSTMFSADATDLNGLSRPALSTLSGGEVLLGKDIDLGISYSGMGDYDTWRPIGSNAFPFSTTFSGGGKTLYNLAVNPFYYGADLSDASLGLFGVVGIGGTVKNLNLAAKSTADETPFYRQPGVRVAQGVSTAGALTGVLAGGRLESCLVSIPVYTLADTPADPGYADDWSAVPYLGASFSASLGGLVGKVTEDSSIVNCGYTGYVYADPKAPRPGSDSPVPDGQTTGPVGGLVGSVATGKALTVKSSYAASYVGGSTAGALVGDAAGALHLDGVCYDANALAGDISPVGRGLVTSGTVSSAISAELGDGWIPDTPDGLYPLQSSLSASPDTLAGRMRISLSPNAGSATSGTLLYSDGTLACSATQPGVSAIPGTAVVTGGKTFVKTVDGLTQLELQQSSAARRVLINLRCWYDDVKLVDGVRHYTITTAEELWELGQIVSGGITDSGISKVAHTHAPSGGYDDFSGAVVHLAADIDLTKLTDQVSGVAVQRPWSSIGTEERLFNGTLEGGGHLVFGMFSNPVAGTQGLFGTVSGTVQNLLVSGASLKLPTGGTGGVLAARLTGTGSLLFCGVSGSVSAEGEGVTAGGLAGSSAGTIAGSFSTAELSTAGAVSSGALGGLVGSLSGGGITQSYFTGFVNAPYASAVGGIAAEQTGGAVSHCYVSAYLDGTVVYRISKTSGDDCRYDGRHLSKGTGGTRQDGIALAMAGTGWTPGNGEHYPFPARFSPDGGIPDLSATSLGAAAKLAAAIFIFGGSTGGANYARFQTVTAPSLAAAGYSLRSGNPTLLTVSDGLARPVDDSSGEVALRLCLSPANPAPFQRPCWLSIPSALAVAYRFNWDELITLAGNQPNPKYNTSLTTDGSASLIRTAADWNDFVTLANSGGTAGKTFVLDRDIDFGGASISTVTVPFYGSFQGGGHTLSNFITSAPLFSSVAQGAKVEFLALSNGNLSVSSNTAPLIVALVAGTNAGRIANVAADSCSVSVTRTLTTDLSTVIGGLVGQNSGTLDTCYFYTPTITSPSTSQVTSYYPINTTPTKQRMGGLAGINTGSITGCYAAFTPLCHIGGLYSGNTDYYSALAGLNDGGTIRYSYWRFAYDYGGAISLTSYKSSDGSTVGGSSLYAGTTDPARTALWLSADSYGGSYYVDGGQLKLYAFRLVKYDLSALFGSDAEQYLMLALQFGTGENAMSSNAICSWKDYLLPNFANLPKTSFLTVRIPVLSSHLTYEISQTHIIRKTMDDLSAMDLASVSGTARGGYSVTGLGDNSTRVLLDLRLTKPAPGSVPWGAYRSDSTLPKSEP